MRTIRRRKTKRIKKKSLAIIITTACILLTAICFNIDTILLLGSGVEELEMSELPTEKRYMITEAVEITPHQVLYKTVECDTGEKCNIRLESTDTPQKAGVLIQADGRGGCVFFRPDEVVRL